MSWIRQMFRPNDVPETTSTIVLGRGPDVARDPTTYAVGLNYAAFWAERYPELTFTVEETPEGDMEVRVQSLIDSRTVRRTAAWCRMVRTRASLFAWEMRGVDDDVCTMAADMQRKFLESRQPTPPIPHSPIVQREFRAYDLVDA